MGSVVVELAFQDFVAFDTIVVVTVSPVGVAELLVRLRLSMRDITDWRGVVLSPVGAAELLVRLRLSMRDITDWRGVVLSPVGVG
jgi:hypothetical protein